VKIDSTHEVVFKQRMQIVTWVTLVLPPVTGIFMLSFVGVFPFPEVFYPFTDYGAIVLLFATVFALIINKKFVNNITQLAKSPDSLEHHQYHLKKLPFYYFGILFFYFAVGLFSTLYSLSTLYGFNYPASKYFISFLGVIPGGLITALPIFFYLTDTLGRYLAPNGVHVSIAPIKLKLIILGLFVPVLIDTLLIMYYYDRTGYFAAETIGIWFFLIAIALVGTVMAWKSFQQSLSPFVVALNAGTGEHTELSIVPQSLDELGLLSHRWHSLWGRVLGYEQRLANLNVSLKSDVVQRTQELESEKFFIQKVLENAASLVIVLDNKGQIVRFNPACEKLTGFSFNEFKKRPIWEWLIPYEDLTNVKKVFFKLLNEGLDSGFENEVMKIDGSRVRVAWNNSTIRDQKGNVEFIIAVGLDITERQATQLALRRAKESAERANITKTNFLSNMNHELRTPMNAILGFGQLLNRDKTLDSDQRDSVNEILDAGHLLMELISDVLDLTTIEAGKLKLDIEDTNISEIISSAVLLLLPQAQERNIKLINNVKPDSKYIARVDRVRFKQVIVNLLSNAIKYNIHNGKVCIDIELIPHNKINISVKDTGPGISSEMRDKLFVPFERLDNGNNYSVQGAGIGLTLSKHIAELMSGVIRFENNSDQGCTFNVEFPLVSLQEMDLNILSPTA